MDPSPAPRSAPPDTSETGYDLRQRIGAGLGAVLFAAMLFLPPLGTLDAAATKVALLTALMAVLWVTEAAPIPATALLPLVLLPLLGIAPIRQAATPYADPVIYLFMGGFMLALAMERCRLHLRLALAIIATVGTNPRSLVLGFLCAGAFISMWTSNSATAMMLLPIGVSVYSLLQSSSAVRSGAGETGAALVLAIAYGSNIGGMGTLIGTPPNAVLKAYLERSHGISIGFGQWMMLGVPLILLALPVAWLILTRLSFRVPASGSAGVRDEIASARAKLGPLSRAEWTVAGAFVLAVTLWISREFWKGIPPLGPLLTDEVIAMGTALLLFFIPAGRGQGFVLSWSDMRKLPWDVLILFGGGLSLAAALEKTGLVLALAQALEGMNGWPPLAVVFLVTLVMIFATALTSNTATATAFLPVTGALALAVGQPALLLCVPVALAASADFMLPVGTPPNAIAYGSGLVPLPRMVRAGLWMNLTFALLLPVLMWTLGRWVFKL
ncbi:DASS family sodium-coupled anion symporter [Oleiharenicola lentus]|uniref:DASS family sodium-coupled anion symporter n=1 Tax=Oleiharenicola lentus TaxID=2508720 RepID=A0A4Q1CC78_9BACT|nr:DASS family sodium-coupled anion symporter [Oleiharenicola lentus]RXK56556.1 DASS family sodium-coupled anion symporter [Oleiharenicola lentus]